MRTKLTFCLMLLAILAFSTMGNAQETTDEKISPEEELVRVKAEQIELKQKEKRLKAELKMKDSKVMREARKEVEHDLDKDEDQRKHASKVASAAHITGCTEDETAAIARDLDPSAFGEHSYQSYVKMVVVNPYPDLTILDEKGAPVVQGLCKNGTISLFKSRNMWRDGNEFSFHYIAKGTFPDGTVGFAESPNVRLSSYDVSSGRNQKFITWIVQLKRVNPTLR